MRYVFWWNSPCKGMIGVLREFCKIAPDTVVYTGPTGSGRIAMGWDNQSCLFEQHKIISSDPVEHRTLLQQHLTDFHIVNGLVAPFYRELATEIATKHLYYATMTEAPCNMFSGIRNFEKAVFQKFIQPIRHKKFAKTAKGFISLSGNKSADIQQIINLGFKKEKIFSFGYYTDVSQNLKYLPSKDGKIHMLCPGLLEPYKGVDILILAIAKLINSKITNFVCHITGNGSQKKYLENLINKNNLKDVVIMHGALKEQDFSDLLQQIDMLVAPGRNEPWGIRVNEAIQRGQAVIVSDHLGASVLIEESKGGAVFTSGSISDLYVKLADFLSNPQKITDAKKRNKLYSPLISCEYKAQELFGILNSIKKNKQ